MSFVLRNRTDERLSNVKIKINAFTKRMYAMVKMIAWMVVMKLDAVSVEREKDMLSISILSVACYEKRKDFLSVMSSKLY